MIASEIISEDFPSLKLTDSVNKALTLMDEFKVLHLPVVNEGLYLGMVTELSLLDVEDPENIVESLKDQYLLAKVNEGEHLFEALKIMSVMELTTLPVVEEKGAYVGSISNQHLLNSIAFMPVVQDLGGIIILSIRNNDYSMSQIAQIVESNNAKIIGSFITRIVDENQFELTLKVSKEDIEPIIQTFERYSYNILASYQKEKFENDLQYRYELLMRYLKF